MERTVERTILLGILRERKKTLLPHSGFPRGEGLRGQLLLNCNFFFLSSARQLACILRLSKLGIANSGRSNVAIQAIQFPRLRRLISSIDFTGSASLFLMPKNKVLRPGGPMPSHALLPLLCFLAVALLSNGQEGNNPLCLLKRPKADHGRNALLGLFQDSSA